MLLALALHLLLDDPLDQLSTSHAATSTPAVADEAIALMRDTVARAERERALMKGRHDPRGLTCIDASLRKLRQATHDADVVRATLGSALARSDVDATLRALAHLGAHARDADAQLRAVYQCSAVAESSTLMHVADKFDRYYETDALLEEPPPPPLPPTPIGAKPPVLVW